MLEAVREETCLRWHLVEVLLHSNASCVPVSYVYMYETKSHVVLTSLLTLYVAKNSTQLLIPHFCFPSSRIGFVFSYLQSGKTLSPKASW